MQSILASGPSDDDAKKQVSLVKGEEYSDDENTWETYENVLESSMDLF